MKNSYPLKGWPKYRSENRNFYSTTERVSDRWSLHAFTYTSQEITIKGILQTGHLASKGYTLYPIMLCRKTESLPLFVLIVYSHRFSTNLYHFILPQFSSSVTYHAKNKLKYKNYKKIFIFIQSNKFNKNRLLLFFCRMNKTFRAGTKLLFEFY